MVTGTRNRWLLGARLGGAGGRVVCLPPPSRVNLGQGAVLRAGEGSLGKRQECGAADISFLVPPASAKPF